MLRMIRGLVVLVVLGGACSSRQVVVDVEPADGCESDCGRAPLSCVEDLRLRIWGDAAADVGGGVELSSKCVALPATAREETLCGADLAGLIELSVPDTAVAVDVTGMGPGPRGTPCRGSPLWTGGAALRDAPSLRVRLRCQLDCRDRERRSRRIKVHDFLTGEVPLAFDDLQVELGLLYDDRELHFPGESGITVFAPMDMDVSQRDLETGEVLLEGDAFDVPAARPRCLAVRLSLRETATTPTVSCLKWEEDSQAPIVWWVSQAANERLDEFASEGYIVGRVLDSELPRRDVQVRVEAASTRPVSYDYDADLRPVPGDRGSTGAAGIFVVRGQFVGLLEVEKQERGGNARAGTLAGHASAVILEMTPLL